LEEADIIASVPMTEASESLNAVVAAAVVMYEALRQRSPRMPG
jgi:tRNA G18 (ribose-2'-O)-methylase SpoU